MQQILIIGQGLAGSILGYELIARGFHISILDEEAPTSSSKIAAGIINPITGKRLKKDKNFDLFLSAAKTVYKQIENQLSASFFHKNKMLRILRNKNELKKLERRTQDPKYTPYIKAINKPHTLNDNHSDPWGSFELNEVYTLNTKTFLQQLSTYFKSKNCFITDALNYQDLTIEGSKVCYKEKTYDFIIFCEGYKAKDNPWFSWLPFNPAKGEILTIQSSEALPKRIINASCWLVPVSQYEGKVGATYSWDPLNETPTEEGKSELLESIPSLISELSKIEIKDHEAAVRPCTQDNHPFIGFHPKHPSLGIFNGFGTKGTLMIPLFAKQLADYLEGKGDLDSEADIKRVSHE